MKRILIVDDEIDPRQTAGPNVSYMWYYIQALRDRGFEVVPATSPDEAIQRLESDSAGFDLLVLDIMMPPGMILDPKEADGGIHSGVLLAELIVEKVPDLPILFLTNVVDRREYEELGRKKNVRGVFFKPNSTPFALADAVQGIVEANDS